MQYPPAVDAHDAPLGLVMIVKNEAQSINVTLASARPHIDFWTMMDTGSTDGTQRVIQDSLRDVPGIALLCPLTTCLWVHSFQLAFGFIPCIRFGSGGQSL